MPEVSVVMSVYNGEAALPSTLSSLLQQTGCDFEIIAINDGSTDQSGQVLDAWAAENPRLRVFHQPNQGLTRALIRGCNEASGEFIARQDVGDASRPGRLAAQARLLRSDPSLVFAGCRYALVGPGNEPLTDGEPPQGATADSGLRNRDGSAVASPHHGTAMFRKSAYAAAGGYRPEFYYAQDVDLWSRLIDQGDFGQVPEVLYQVKFDLDSITASHRAEQQSLRALVAHARALRSQGRSDAPVLAQAQRIRPGGSSPVPPAPRRDSRPAANYFVGSCLASRGDPRAKSYLTQTVRAKPLHLKAWFKLAKLALSPSKRAL